ncbi:hypothetical protein L210DRAFT_948536 [Boletus edulis BED1]|uniref:Uncharacterized protein n=1 Tax=Boletus edulis BED1 TaxID=1328754 RepID=A0AAD4GCF9_BOLED|nr:hypothetical protein L210DRAFT_948536 [Boletus edulis BED1]
MPVDTFLEYLPATEEPLPDLPENPFENVPSNGKGVNSINPLSLLSRNGYLISPLSIQAVILLRRSTSTSAPYY